MNGEEILEGRGMRIRRDPGSTAEVERAHVEGAKGANGGPPHIHLFQDEGLTVHSGALNVRWGQARIPVGPGEEIRSVEEFFRDLFALPTDRRGNPRIGDAGRLMRAYPDEFLYFPLVPASVQRALAVPLSKLGTTPR